jgi:GT2 family glycosyltransferase
MELPSTADTAGITVLLCGYNSAGRLPATVRALAALAPPSAAFAVELLVVDNASTDDTAAVARRLLEELRPSFSYQVLQEPRAGKPHALELGLAKAHYRYVCIVDDDNWLAPDYLNLSWAIMESNPQIGALGGRAEAVCEVTPPAWFTEYAIDYAADRQAPQSGDMTDLPGFVFGAGCIIRSAAWRRVLAAGFESLLVKYPGLRSSGEDVEMCYALALAGYRIWYDERLHFQHFIPANRLTWPYVCSLYASNACSEVDLRPYRQFLQRISAAGSLLWLRNGLYTTRYMVKHARLALRAGKMRPAEAAEGSRDVLLASYFRRVLQNYIRKEASRDAGFARIAAFIYRLNALPSQPS